MTAAVATSVATTEVRRWLVCVVIEVANMGATMNQRDHACIRVDTIL
jgi:hypothetical protein